MVKILIPEETPSLNKGEAAIFFGIFESLRDFLGDIEITMFSFDREVDSARYAGMAHIIDAMGIMPKGIMFKELRRLEQALEYVKFFLKHFCFLCAYCVFGRRAIGLMRRDVWTHYIESDAVIMAHDSAFAPLYHSILIFFLKRLGKPVIIYGASFPTGSTQPYSMKGAFYRSLIKRALAAVDLITVREKDSYDYLQGLGVGRRAHLTGDLAFLVKPVGPERIAAILEREGLDGKTPMVGMTISRNMIKQAYPHIREYRAKEEKFIAEIAKVIDHITSTLGARVVFVPHSILKDEDRDDRIVAKKILKVVRNPVLVTAIEDEYSPEELKGLTSLFEMCLGTRLHFIVDAVSTHVPSVILSGKNDFRINGIIGKGMGLPDSIYYIEDLDHRTLIETLESFWNRREEIRQDIVVKMDKVLKETMLNGMILKEFFDKLPKPDHSKSRDALG